MGAVIISSLNLNLVTSQLKICYCCKGRFFFRYSGEVFVFWRVLVWVEDSGQEFVQSTCRH